MEGSVDLKQAAPLLVVCGPTAGGKTSLSIALARRFDGEVVSADSMQVYRRLNIGTAKPTAAERRGVPHHLMDFLEPGQRFSVAQYVPLARRTVAEIAARGKLPILCGGTGLYIDSTTKNVQYAEIPENPALRKELRVLADVHGNAAVWRLLSACDPRLAETLHPNNLGRVIRGVEVYRATGVALSEWQRRSLRSPAPYDLCVLGLDFRSRQTLYERIDARVDNMLRQGLVAEARALYGEGLAGTAGQAIGYKELFAHFRGDISYGEAVAALKQGTRRYAKRQLTWFRRTPGIRWLYADDYNDDKALIQEAFTVVEDAYGQNH